MIEKRINDTGYLTIEKRDGDEESRTIVGYALNFNKWSADLGGSWFRFKEKIDKRALKGTDLSAVVATFNHNFDNVLARADSDTLDLTIDKKGLKYSFDAPNTTAGNDLLENVRNKNVKGSSFMFTVDKETWTYNDDPAIIDERVIDSIDELIELGPVTMPAYLDTSVSQRDFETTYKEQREKNKPEPQISYDYKLRLLKLKNKV